MIDPAGLVEVARTLNAGQDAQPPSSEAVRRAVSTAYYALFHAVLKESAERFVGLNDDSVAFETIYRGFDHAQVKTVLKEVDKQALSSKYKRLLRRDAMSRSIRDFAAIFVPMQELRHLADYNPSIFISRSEAADLIDEVEVALQALAGADPDEKADLFAIMLAGARGA